MPIVQCGGSQFAIRHDGRVVTEFAVPAIANTLRDVAITGVFYCPSYLREPWGGTIPPMPGSVWFHVVTSGRCVLVVGMKRASSCSPATLSSSRTALATR